MNAQDDAEVRAAVRALADETRPVDLTVGALRAGHRRIRRRRAGVIGVSIVAAVAAIAVPYGLLGRPTLPPNPAASSPAPVASASIGAVPSSGAIRLPGGLIVLAAHSGEGEPSQIYDRAAGRYITMEGRPEPAPRGTLVLEVSGDSGATLVRNLKTMRTWAVDVAGGFGGERPATWSPNGRFLAAHIVNERDRSERIVIVNAVTRDLVHKYEIDPVAYRCHGYCGLTWSPDGTEVGLTLTDTSVPHDESKADAQRGVQYFSVATGEPTRFVKVPGWIPGAHSWSPDSEHVVIEGRTRQGRNATQVVDARYGHVTATLPTGDPSKVWWTHDRQVVYVDSGEIVYAQPSGEVTRRITLPDELVGARLTLASE